MLEDENQVVEPTQTAPSESPATPEKQEVDTSKIFSKGYNEGKAKAERDLVSKLRSLGIEAEELDDAFSSLQKTITPKKEEANEVDALRKMLEEANNKVKETQDQYESFVYESRVESTVDSAINSLKEQASLSLKEDHLKNLFYMEYEIEEHNGQLFASKGETPILDSKGDRKPLSAVISDFAKDNGYMTPKAQGTGGSSGHTQFSDKPSRSEFNKLIRSKSMDAQSKAAALYSQYKQAGGWAE